MGSDIKSCCREEFKEDDKYRRRCGCLKTSEKLKEILRQFPPPPPPTPSRAPPPHKLKSSCISAYCAQGLPITTELKKSNCSVICAAKCNRDAGAAAGAGAGDDLPKPRARTKPESYLWCVGRELVQLLQLSVTVTALAIYYLIYCYMQLLYYTVRSAIYFHNADRAMKVTIAAVTISSLIVGFYVLMRIERLLGLTKD